MSPRSVFSVLALVVAVSLIGAPLTMHDWGEKAAIGAEPIENTSSVSEETPVLQYESVSPNAQQAIRVASQRGGVTIYGTEDWPNEFAYGDVLEPGSGRYVVVYEGQSYRVTTVGGVGVGKDPVERTAFQLPFVGYGLSFFKERIPSFTAGVNPTAASQPTDDTLAGYSTPIRTIK